ncbi:MAG TPA: glycosyltransferase [Bryobacteraceae bacterium]
MKPRVKVAFASGTDELNRRLIERLRAIFPDLPLYVVSDFPPGDPDLFWIPYHVNRSFGENLARCRAELHGRSIRLAAVMLVPNVPFRRMRLMALTLAPLHFLAFNENLNNFMLRPGSVPAILRHIGWRVKNLLRWSWRTARSADRRLLRSYVAARGAGLMRPRRRAPEAARVEPREPGISVVIPSRNGRELCAMSLPALPAGRARFEIIVVDNGSTDGTADYLRTEFSRVRVDVSAAPLSFARAVNRGIAWARYSHVCLLNNDMLVESDFFDALAAAFEQVPDLFCATAQIRFPPGRRREETGKTVMAQRAAEDFPVRCDEPLPGEDLTYVLYGSGGCSLYDATKLAALGGVDEAFEPAYVEDLDLGWRAWQRGWPSVYVAGAVVEHRHRATTSRYYSEEQLDRILEVNYLKFLARAVADPRLFRRLWGQALRRLLLRKSGAALDEAAAIALAGGAVAKPALPEERFLALADGSLAVFPGRAGTGKPRVLVASPYVPFPLSHGGAVRIYNLMRRAANEYDQILVAFREEAAPPAPELLEICAEVVLIHRAGSHSLRSQGRPDVVEEFASATFNAALEQTVRKWRPAIVQFEFTQMAQYAADCVSAKTVLVEHDITVDLYEQLLAIEDSWERRRQLGLWRRFESQAWRTVDRVVTMSEKDRRLVAGAAAVTLANGVDLDRFRPAAQEPEPRRLLFIGSFAHLPNRMAVEFFVSGVLPLLRDVTLHIIAGARHESFRVAADLGQPGIEVEGFVADVRPAYARAALVVAPLTASAGTNIKILEAMAMDKAVVSTPAGVNGLDLVAGEDFVLVKTAEEMAAGIERLLDDASERRRIESAARARVERDYGWDAIARRQARMYRGLMA